MCPLADYILSCKGVATVKDHRAGNIGYRCEIKQTAIKENRFVPACFNRRNRFSGVPDKVAI